MTMLVGRTSCSSRVFCFRPVSGSVRPRGNRMSLRVATPITRMFSPRWCRRTVAGTVGANVAVANVSLTRFASRAPHSLHFPTLAKLTQARLLMV